MFLARGRRARATTAEVSLISDLDLVPLTLTRNNLPYLASAQRSWTTFLALLAVRSSLRRARPAGGAAG